MSCCSLLLLLSVCTSALAAPTLMPDPSYVNYKLQDEVPARQGNAAGYLMPAAVRSCNVDGGCWPSLYILGAQKCATTSIFGILERHHLVCGRKGADRNVDAKEAHFWDAWDKFEGEWDNILKNPYDLKDYLAGYQSTPDCVGAFMDATPSYLRDYNVASRMVVAMPPNFARVHVRMLVVLREPIARDVSFYNMFRGEWNKAGSPSADNVEGLGLISKNLCGQVDEIAQGHFPTYDQAVVCEIDHWNHCVAEEGGSEKGYRRCSLDSEFVKDLDTDRTRLTDGMYLAQIPRFSERFPRKHIMVMQFEDLVSSDTQLDYLQRILRFYGLPQREGIDSLPRDNEWEFDGKVDLPSCRTRDALSGVFEEWNQRLYASLADERAQGITPEMEPDFKPFTQIDCIMDSGDAGEARRAREVLANGILSSGLKEHVQGTGDAKVGHQVSRVHARDVVNSHVGSG